MPPTGAHWPDFTFAAIRSKITGWCCLIQAYCWACEQAKMNSGYSLANAVTVAKVRAVLRIVSRCGQSHALSICA
jgi:hypothetical protein